MHMNCHEQPDGPRAPREPWEVHDLEMGELEMAQSFVAHKPLVDSEDFRAWLEERANAAR